jgi:hypothetical protein
MPDTIPLQTLTVPNEHVSVLIHDPSEQHIGLLAYSPSNESMHHSDDTVSAPQSTATLGQMLIQSTSTPALSKAMSTHDLMKHAEIGKLRGVKNYLSRIFHGGFHLRRLAPLKDLLVPSGPQAGTAGSMFNLINATFGAGMLSLPFATQEVGIVLAVLLILAFGALTVVTLRLMVQAAEKSSASTYEVLMFKSFGVCQRRVFILCLTCGEFE